MNRMAQAFAAAALAAAGVAAAQTSPSSPTPSDSASIPATPYPGSTAPSSSTEQMPGDSRASATGKAATKAQMRDCMTKQLSNNAGQRKEEARKYCRSQLNGSPNG